MSSLKIERDTFQRDLAAPSGVAPKGGPLPGTSGKHPVAEAVGTALTGGKSNAGAKGYLRVCRSQVAHKHPSWSPCYIHD
jgi:hypothetical protein